MFKRPRLRPTSALVNVSFAAAVIFLVACSGDPDKTEETPPESGAEAAITETARDEITLQAVWATRALSASIVDLALSGGNDPILAALLETGELQLFDLEGDRITAPEALDIVEIASGQPVNLEDAPLTLFPGIDQEGSVNVYAYNSVLGAPVPLDLLPGVGAAGICAGVALTPNYLLQIAYWTDEAPETLVHGHVSQEDGELVWVPIGTLESANGPIGSCVAGLELISRPADASADLAELTKLDRRFVISRTASGELRASEADLASMPMSVRNGLTIEAPTTPTAIAALGEVRFGGYPNGVIVLGGDRKITFVEPQALFETRP